MLRERKHGPGFWARARCPLCTEDLFPPEQSGVDYLTWGFLDPAGGIQLDPKSK